MSETLIVIIHIGLAVCFFYILNWIGQQTVSLGYIQLSTFARQDEAPAFNFILRTVSPTIYIILLSAILYALGEESLIKGIWRVVLFYFLYRSLYNVAFGRASLMNWRSFITQGIIAVTLAYFLYHMLILTKKYIVPDIDTLANELWLVIIFFLYSVLNRIQRSDEGIRRRRLNYIKKNYSRFKNQYGDLVTRKAMNQDIQYLAYAIMIYENFGRPRFLRFFEDKIPRKKLTRGIMQVRSANKISDQESVNIAIKKLNLDYKKSLKKAQIPKIPQMEQDDIAGKLYKKRSALRKTIALYNKDTDYISEVEEIADELARIDNREGI